jgi:hypothetical protein
MSTASEVSPAAPTPPRTGHAPGALALLTATALGSIAASRLPKAPLVLAAGAAALALLKQKKTPPPRVVAEPSPFTPPPPPADIPQQSQVEQWLHQQIEREAQAPVIPLSSPDISAIPEENEYIPQSFLIDDAEENAPESTAHESFATLTEPVRRVMSPAAEPEPVIAARAPESPPAFRFTPPAPVVERGSDDLPALQALEATEACPTASNAAWLLGIEPVPSLSEPATPASSEERVSFFTAAPAAPPVFTMPVFQGGTLPDEIDVVPPPAPEPPVAHLLPVFTAPAAVTMEPTPLSSPLVLTSFPFFAAIPSTSPVPVPMSAEEPPAPVAESAPVPVVDVVDVVEIAVQLAAPGEASFDAPLDPWQSAIEPPAPETAASVEAAPPSPPSGPVIDAEIILRPRAPTQNTVTAKTRPFAPVIAKSVASDEAPALDPAASAIPSPPSPPNKRPSWRSMWRGD